MASSSQFLPTMLLLLATIAMILPSDAQSPPPTCVSQTFTANRLYSFCSDLPTLNSYLHWTYNEANSTLSLAFVARPAGPDGWISWAINPTATGMAGSQALVAFKDSTTGAMTVKTFDISSYSDLKESKVWYDVKDSYAEVSGGVMRIFATLVLPEKGKTALNHVWQVGPSVSSGFPAKHDFQKANLDAKGNLDLLRGQSTTAAAAGNSRIKKRNIHGVLNVVSWGIMFPVGIIIARYLRAFPSANPASFYLHVSCQVSAYAIGVAGWGTGLKLGSESKGVTYSYHRNIGITLFALATLQVFALLLRPKPDHKYRFYWNIYHHGVGYAIVILGIINVFKGFDILKPDHKWRRAYIIVIAVLGGMAVFLEAITWIIVLRRKGSSKSATKNYDGFDNGHIGQQPLDP